MDLVMPNSILVQMFWARGQREQLGIQDVQPVRRGTRGAYFDHLDPKDKNSRGRYSWQSVPDL